MLGSVSSALRGCCTLKTLTQVTTYTAGSAALLSGAAAAGALYRQQYGNPQTKEGQRWKEVTSSALNQTAWWGLAEVPALDKLKDAKLTISALQKDQQTGQQQEMLTKINDLFPKLEEETKSTAGHEQAVNYIKQQIQDSNSWHFCGRKFEETAEIQAKAVKYLALASLAFIVIAAIPTFAFKARQITGL